MLKKCLKCKDDIHCCIQGFTFVGIKDAMKIKKHLNDNSFLDYSKLPNRLIKLIEDDDPSLEGYLRYSLLDKDNKILRIKKVKGKCIFLKNGKCEIYAIRPKICRIYPYWCVKLINGRVKVIEHDSDSECVICDVDNLSKIKEAEIKKLFNEILKEAKYYKDNHELIKKTLSPNIEK